MRTDRMTRLLVPICSYLPLRHIRGLWRWSFSSSGGPAAESDQSNAHPGSPATCVTSMKQAHLCCNSCPLSSFNQGPFPSSMLPAFLFNKQWRNTNAAYSQCHQNILSPSPRLRCPLFYDCDKANVTVSLAACDCIVTVLQVLRLCNYICCCSHTDICHPSLWFSTYSTNISYGVKKCKFASWQLIRLGYPLISEVSTADAVTMMCFPVSSIPTAAHLFWLSESSHFSW